MIIAYIITALFFLTALSLAFAAYAAGAVIALKKILEKSHENNQSLLEKLQNKFDSKIDDYNEIIKKASDSNLSLGVCVKEFDEKIKQIEDRVNMLGSFQTKGPSTWQKR